MADLRRKPKLEEMKTSAASKTLESEMVEVDGKKIHCVRTGTGKHTLLLLPGALGSGRTDFGPQLENLNKDMFSIVAWDPPGYGQSYPPERDFSGDFLKKDAHLVAKVMEALGISKYSLVGWSDGGITALKMAALYPNAIRKMVVFGANSYVTKEETEGYEKIRDIDKWNAKMRQPFIDLYGEDYFRKLWTDWIDAFVQRYYIEYKTDVCRDALAKIQCPTLVIHGARDPMIGQFHADYIHEKIKGSRLVNLPEGRHNLHLRYYKEFNSILESFLVESNL